MCGGMQSTSPARTTISLPSIQNLSAPSTMYVSCSFRWLCSGTTQPFFSRTRASMRFSPVIIWRSSSGFSFSSSTSFQRMCFSMLDILPKSRYAEYRGALFLCDCHLVVADGCGINLVRQLEGGVQADFRVFRREIFAHKVFQRHARDFIPIEGYRADMDFALAGRTRGIGLNRDVVRTVKHGEQRVGTVLALLDLIEVNQKESCNNCGLSLKANLLHPLRQLYVACGEVVINRSEEHDGWSLVGVRALAVLLNVVELDLHALRQTMPGSGRLRGAL